jgi:hypothetical protein
VDGNFYVLVNLKKLQKRSLAKTLHHTDRSLRRDSHQVPGEAVVISQLIFTSKRIKVNGAYMISNPAAEIFEIIAKDLKMDNYLVPCCADKHIGEAIKKTALDLQ